MVFSIFPISWALLVVLAFSTVVWSDKASYDESSSVTNTRCSDDCTQIESCQSDGSCDYFNCLNYNSKYCVVNTTTCGVKSSGNHCFNNNIPHAYYCTGNGTFPAPDRCDVAYVCIGSLNPSLTCTCDAGEYFDAITGTCVERFGCLHTPADCTSLGQTGDLGNGFCYTCNAEYKPVVLRCSSTDTDTLTTAPVLPEDSLSSGSTRGMTCVEYVWPPAQTTTKDIDVTEPLNKFYKF